MPLGGYYLGFGDQLRHIHASLCHGNLYTHRAAVIADVRERSRHLTRGVIMHSHVLLAIKQAEQGIAIVPGVAFIEAARADRFGISGAVSCRNGAVRFVDKLYIRVFDRAAGVIADVVLAYRDPYECAAGLLVNGGILRHAVVAFIHPYRARGVVKLAPLRRHGLDYGVYAKGQFFRRFSYPVDICFKIVWKNTVPVFIKNPEFRAIQLIALLIDLVNDDLAEFSRYIIAQHRRHHLARARRAGDNAEAADVICRFKHVFPACNISLHFCKDVFISRFGGGADNVLPPALAVLFGSRKLGGPVRVRVGAQAHNVFPNDRLGRYIRRVAVFRRVGGITEHDRGVAGAKAEHRRQHDSRLRRNGHFVNAAVVVFCGSLAAPVIVLQPVLHLIVHTVCISHAGLYAIPQRARSFKHRNGVSVQTPRRDISVESARVVDDLFAAGAAKRHL